LRPRPFRSVHIDRQTQDDTAGAPLRGESEDAFGVEIKAFACDGFDRGCDPPVGIAGSDPDRLAAEIEADQRAARRQHCGGVGKRENGHKQSR